MAKKKREHKILNEFKTFISRGNVVDLAVGVIIGGAFSAIVSALTDHILKPLINWLIASICTACGATGGLESAITILQPGYTDGVLDLSKSIYIDWGAFISAIINFFLIAIILFLIVKAINTAKAKADKIKAAEQEKYYQKHPEERPAPVEPGVPAPTEVELLAQIRDLLAKEGKEQETKKSKNADK